MKRGQVEIQFNWVMLLIAGALIFLFFFSIIRWAKTSSDESQAAKTSYSLDAILTGASVTKNTVNILELPIERIDFYDSIETSCHAYRVDESRNQRNIRNKILFAPSRIEGSRLITWTLSWNVPFRVDNFLFFSSPLIRYIFIGAEYDPIFQYINKTFPVNLTPEFYTSPPVLQDENNFKVRIVYINQEPKKAPSNSANPVNTFNKMPGEDVTALKITGTDLDNIEVTFYDKTDPATAVNTYFTLIDNTRAPVGEAALFGAIFSDHPDYYDCNMQKAIARLKNVAEVYKKRSEALETEYSGTNCYTPHNGAKDALTTYLNSLNQDLSALQSSLKESNRQAQIYSCALIY